MNIHLCAHEHPYRLADSATHPIEPRCDTLAALLLLAGMSLPGRPKGEYRSAQHEGTPVSPQRPRALPARRITAHSGAANCGF
jgi:hypothetical protein